MNRLLCGVLWVGLGSAFAVGAGCSGAPAPSAPVQAKTDPVVAQKQECARSMPGVGAVRYSELRQGGAVVLARHGGTTLAYVADEDSRAIHTIDLAKKEQVARTTLSGAPAQL